MCDYNIMCETLCKNMSLANKDESKYELHDYLKLYEISTQSPYSVVKINRL